MLLLLFKIKDFLGLNVESMDGHYLDKLSAILHASPSVDWKETLIGALTMTVLLVWPKFRSKIPGHLVALFVGSLLAWVLSLYMAGFSVATIGSRFSYEINGITGSGIPPMLPTFAWPWHLPGADGAPIGISFELVRLLLPSAVFNIGEHAMQRMAEFMEHRCNFIECH